MFTKAMTIGGDTDTIACMAGGIFQATCSTQSQIRRGDSGCTIAVALAMSKLKLHLPAELNAIIECCNKEFTGCRGLSAKK